MRTPGACRRSTTRSMTATPGRRPHPDPAKLTAGIKKIEEAYKTLKPLFDQHNAKLNVMPAIDWKGRKVLWLDNKKRDPEFEVHKVYLTKSDDSILVEEVSLNPHLYKSYKVTETDLPSTVQKFLRDGFLFSKKP